MRKLRRLILLLMALCLMISGCAEKQSEVGMRSVDKPNLPENLTLSGSGEPMLDVYDIAAEAVEKTGIEEYVMGVVAGEMKNDWPLEALKAQAILARTFVLKFCDTKKSRYEGADISTDIEEAQAYAPDKINDHVRKAVEDTSGMVMTSEGEYPYAWFYAHAGGRTELPSVALDFNKEDPKYLSVVESPDSEKAPENVKRWTAEFSFGEVIMAAEQAGLRVEDIENIEIGEKGESGRAKTLLINGRSVSSPSFRIAIGASKLKSTLIDAIEMGEGTVTFRGSGYGHGVGMSQWGAFAMAEEGKTAPEIIQHYFNGVDIVDMW